MIIPNYIIVILLILGLATFLSSYFFSRFIKLKIRIFMFLFGIFISLFGMYGFDKVVIINNDSSVIKRHYLSILGNFEYELNNYSNIYEPVNKCLIVNNTKKEVIISQIEYYDKLESFSHFGEEYPQVATIPPFSSLNFVEGVDYFFNELPEEIYQDKKSSKVKYWLCFKE